ncbi:MAG: hypothetical protein IJD35_06775 [Clostridia bacterium]|nr:hypothetical protein [Clostridia bacterium]
METTDVKENECLPDETEPSLEEEKNSPAEEAPDWQARCLAAESALADSLAFAALETGLKIGESPIFRRFLDLRAKGLSEQEAFAAAGWERQKTPREERGSPSKAHLVSGAPATLAVSNRISNEDMAIARDLLGEDYPAETIEKLWRRVAKGQ